VKESFPDLDIINRGFGGSQTIDSVHFAPRIVLPYEPKIVVLYAGDNDLAVGKSPETVAADFADFVKVVHEKLPKTKIVYIAVKPSIARWKNIENVRAANKLVAEQCSTNDKLEFLDIAPLVMGDNGEPDPAMFVKDGLHLSPAGYAKWTAKLKPHLVKE
jgi:lysophospholipase L1-like esterase